MESIVPKCINNKTCSSVCNVKACNAMPFLCVDEQCLCYSHHQKCATNIRWKIMKQSLLNKLKKPSSQLDKYFAQVNDLYRSVIKQIDKSFQQINSLADNFGLSQIEREVYSKLKQNKFNEITGELINKVEVELMTGKKQFQIRIIQNEKKQIDKQTTILVQMLQGLTKLSMIKGEQIKSNSPIKQSFISSFKLDSKITQDVGTLSCFFTKKIVSMNLLYRASENNFQGDQDIDELLIGLIMIILSNHQNIQGNMSQQISTNSAQFQMIEMIDQYQLSIIYIQQRQMKSILHYVQIITIHSKNITINLIQISKFWDKCNGNKHTITILKTQFGNVIGGYTPLPWDKNKSKKYQWQTDNSMQSFIFSLTNKHKLTIKQGKQSQAIFHHSNYGPIFGAGHDLLIYDKANQNIDSYGNPGYTYNNNNEYDDYNQQSYKKWSGQSSGYYFKILQWQVYAIVLE